MARNVVARNILVGNAVIAGAAMIAFAVLPAGAAARPEADPAAASAGAVDAPAVADRAWPGVTVHTTDWGATPPATTRTTAASPRSAAAHRPRVPHPVGSSGRRSSGRHLAAQHRAARHPAPRRSSFAAALAAAVNRIPTYRSGVVRWVVSHAYPAWGTADWYHAVLYISPDVPRSLLYDVAVHEWSHELSVLDYGGDVSAATRAMNAWFGGTGLTGAERAADCMAILQGATWTHYTTCTNSHWRAGARLLVAGRPL